MIISIYIEIINAFHLCFGLFLANSSVYCDDDTCFINAFNVLSTEDINVIRSKMLFIFKELLVSRKTTTSNADALIGPDKAVYLSYMPLMYSVLGVLVFLPRSCIILISLISCQDLGFPGFLAKIVDFLDFLPRSWQIILARNHRKIKKLATNPIQAIGNQRKKSQFVFIKINLVINVSQVK